MGNALWLFLALTPSYFLCIFIPFSGGMLTLIPAIGVVCLTIGLVLGIRSKAWPLLTFGVLALISNVYVAVAILLRGSMHNSNTPMFWAFALVQLILAAYLVFRIKGARLPATLLAVFTTTYALFASAIAAMSFSDAWL